jgi:WD40 repeat protein
MAATFRNLAVVIGINAYRPENGIKPLGTAANDARAIAQLLKDEYKYSQIWELYDEQATYEAIKTLLNETLPKEVRKSDHLLFYFAGHGITRKGKDGSPAGYLIPQNAKVNLQNAGNDQSENFLPMQELYDAFKTINCHHLLVILDCCYAGMFRWATRKLGSAYERIHQEHYTRFIRYPAWQVIASAAHDQEALDLVTDERGAVPGTNHSPFALALLQGLGHTDEKLNADLTEDGVITTPELYFYVDKEVNRSTGERQTPGFWSLRYEFDRGEFIFVKPGFDPKKNLTPAPPLNASNNPYRGLESFEEKHARFFFGRQTLVEELSDRLSKPCRCLTIVLGVSGSGKSSLVKAGLIPYLRNKQEKDPQSQKWYILDPMRPGESPFTAFARVILPLEDANLLSQLNQIKGIDEVFKQKKQPNQNRDSSQEAQQIQSNSEKTNVAFTKLADSWNNSTPEAKLLLVVDYFKQLQEICHSEELTNLENTIQKRVARLASDLQKDPRYLTQVIASWSQINPNIKLLLILDQFEELMTMAQEHQGKSDSDQKEWQQFLSMLRMTLASHRHRLHIVLTLRSDFEPRFLDSALKAHWRKGRFPVRAMNSDELREAIEQPARKQALYFEPPDLVGRLIDEVGQMPGALPLLSFTLSELYIKLTKRWIDPNSSDRALRIEDYNQLGGVAGALTRRATEEYENFVKEFGEESGKAHQATMQRVMLRMVTIEGGGVARRRVPESELVYPDAEENKRVAQVSDRLVKARLLVKGQETGEPYLEPAHDFLVRGWDKLQEWIKKQQEDLALQQRLTPAALDWKQGRGMLWIEEVERLAKLEKVLESKTDNWLNQLETEFVTRSIKERQDRIKKLEEDLRISEERRQEAERRTINAAISAQNLAVDNLWNSRLEIDALIKGIENGERVQQLQASNTLDADTEMQVVTKLRRLVDGIRESNRLNHGNRIRNASFSRDGDFIASGGHDGTVKLWKRDGTLLHVLQHRDSNTDFDKISMFRFDRAGTLRWVARPGVIVNFSPDGEMIISSGAHIIKSWRRDGKLLGSVEIKEQATVLDNAISFSPDSNLIAVSLGNKGIQLLDKHCNLLKTLKTPWEPNSSQLESIEQTWRYPYSINPLVKELNATDSDLLKLWLAYQEIQQRPDLGYEYEDLEFSMGSISFSPDGKTIAYTVGHTIMHWNLLDGTLHESWSTRTPQETGRYYWPWTFNSSVKFSPDGENIISASVDGVIKFWDCKGNLLKTLSLNDGISDVSFKPADQMIVTAHRDGVVRLWNFEGVLLYTLEGHIGTISSVSFSPDGKTIISASYDGQVKLWHLREPKPIFLYSPDGPKEAWDQSLMRVRFSPDGQLIALVDTLGVLLEPTARAELADTLDRENPTKTIYYAYSMSFSPDGKMIVSGKYDGNIQLWGLDGKEISDFKCKGHSESERSWINDISFSPNGELIASAGRDHSVRLWRKSDGTLLHILSDHRDSVNSVGFSPNGKLILSASSDGTVKLWELNGILLSTFSGHDNEVYSASFSPDGKIIASASSDRTVRLWKLDGTLLDSLTTHGDGVNSASFSPDGEMIASASNDGTIKLWRRDGTLWQTFIDPRIKRFYSVSFSPDGQKIAALGSDGTQSIRGHGDTRENIQVLVWDLTISNLIKEGCHWLEEYLTVHPDDLNRLPICQNLTSNKKAAFTWVRQGEELARTGDFEGAVVKFRKALAWNNERDFNSQIKAAKEIAVFNLVFQGKSLARDGNIEGAIASFNQALKLDANLDLVPEIEAKRLAAAPTLIEKGKELLREGKVEEAITAYAEAQTFDPTLKISAASWNSLCWFGSLHGQATNPNVMAACEKAVELEPENGSERDSRGLARALTDNTEGAIEDFQAFIASTNNEEEKLQRQRWIDALRAGENPFTPEEIQTLLGQ